MIIVNGGSPGVPAVGVASGATITVTDSIASPAPATRLWSITSKPGVLATPPTFATPTSASSTVTLPLYGTYTIHLDRVEANGDPSPSDVLVLVVDAEGNCLPSPGMNPALLLPLSAADAAAGWAGGDGAVTGQAMLEKFLRDLKINSGQAQNPTVTTDKGTDPGNHPSATGVYTTNDRTYSSSIDTSLTTLKYRYCYDNGVATTLPGAMPVWVMIHTISASHTEITDVAMQVVASRGYFVVNVDLRGRGSSGGTNDLYGREVHDIYDAEDDAHTTFGSIVGVNPVRVIQGCSGGGGHALAAACRAPDRYVATIDVFGISDAGYDLVTSFWADSPGNRSILTTDIGDRSAVSVGDKSILYKYHSRNFRETVADAFRYGGKLFTYHNTGDTTVPPEHTRLVHDELAAAGLRNRVQVESNTEWQHLPLTDSQVAQSAWLGTAYARTASVWTTPPRALFWTVCGYLRTKRFQVWLGANVNPKTDALGGTNHVARVNFDTIVGVYEVRHVDGPLPMYVQIVDGATTLTGNVSVDQGTIVFRRNDPTLTVPVATVDLTVQASATVHTTGANVTGWDDASGNANNFAGVSAFEPQYVANDGDGVAAITFDGSTHSRRFRRAAQTIDLNSQFTICGVVYASGNGWIWTADNSGDNNLRLSIAYNSGLEVQMHNDASAGNIQIGGSMSLNAWHFYIVSRSSGGVLSCYVDGVAGTTATCPASPITHNGITIGCWTANAGALNFFNGKIRWQKEWAVALSPTEMSNLRTLARAANPGLP